MKAQKTFVLQEGDVYDIMRERYLQVNVAGGSRYVLFKMWEEDTIRFQGMSSVW